MQYIQNKKFISLLIVFFSIFLLMVPITAGFKVFSKNSDREDNLQKMNRVSPTPEIIYKDEEVEQVEYIYITPNPTSTPTLAPLPTPTSNTVNFNNRHEKDDD